MRKTKNLIEIQEDVKIGNVILEKGDKIKVIEKDDSFDYQMLDRLKSDCEYCINQAHSIVHLWGKTVDAHIAEMRKIYSLLNEKPEWLSLEDIDRYEKQLKQLSDR